MRLEGLEHTAGSNLSPPNVSDLQRLHLHPLVLNRVGPPSVSRLHFAPDPPHPTDITPYKQHIH